MAIENKLAEAIVKRIRARRIDLSESGIENLPGSTGSTAATATVREANFGDFEHVCALNSHLGQGPDSLENWKRLWRDNPAIVDGGATPRIGWVLEDAGVIVGFLGSIPLLYQYEGKTLIAAATCRFAVEPAYRAFSHLLLSSFFRQKDVDLLLNTTATVAAGRMMSALKAVQLPQKNYDTVLFWILGYRTFAKVTLESVGLSPSLAGVGSLAAFLILRGETALRGRRPRSKSEGFSVTEKAIGEMGPEFLQLWSEKTDQMNVLIAKRTPEIMRWHFEPPSNRRIARVCACYSEGRLLGYAVVRHGEEGKMGLRRSVIADLQLQEQDLRVVDALLAASYQSAQRAGSHVLEVMGFPGRIRQMLLRWKPYSRKYPACPFFFKARDRELHRALANEDAWYASLYDGDSTLWP